jgi:hypothetical protein
MQLPSLSHSSLLSTTHAHSSCVSLFCVPHSVSDFHSSYLTSSCGFSRHSFNVPFLLRDSICFFFILNVSCLSFKKRDEEWNGESSSFSALSFYPHLFLHYVRETLRILSFSAFPFILFSIPLPSQSCSSFFGRESFSHDV